MSSRRWSSRTGDLAIAVLLYLAATVGFASWYSRDYFQRSRFDHQYGHGIYRYRILGRDLVSWTDAWLHANPVGRWLHTPASNGQMYSAFFVVNGVTFLVFALLLRTLLARTRGLTEPVRLCLYIAVLGFVALSSFVVTPYDMTSYALLAAFLLLVLAAPPVDVLAIPVFVLAVLTRESAFVALAAVFAALFTGTRLGWTADEAAAHRARRLCVVSASTGVVAYGLLRLTAHHEPGTAWGVLTFHDNVTSGRGLAGAAMAVLAWIAWRRVRDVCGVTGDRATVSTRRWFLLLCVPYFVVSFLTGLWFELRLLVPVAIGDLWIGLVAMQPRVLTEADQPMMRLTSNGNTRAVCEAVAISTPSGDQTRPSP